MEKIIRENLSHFNLSNGSMRSQHALFGANNYVLEKCTSRMFYQKKLKLLVEKPTAQSNIEQKLPGIEIDWSKTYSYARQITLDSHSRIFFIN